MWARRVLPCCLLHESRGQTWIPRASANQSLPCRLSQSVVSVFLTPGQARSHLCPVGSMCSSHLVTKRGALEQERSHLCHVGSGWSYHVVCATHLVDKRGALEQERTSLYHLGLVKVLCVFFLKPRESKIPSVPCSFNVFLSSCLLHASRGQAWRPRARTNQSLPSGFSQSVVCVFLKPRESKISSVPCSFRVSLPSCLRHASRRQTWTPRASTNQSLPCRFSQSLL